MTLFAYCRTESANMKRLKFKCRLNHLAVLIFLTLLCNSNSYGNPQGSLNANSLTRLWKISNISGDENKTNIQLNKPSENNFESSSYSGFTQMYSNLHPTESKLPSIILPEKTLNHSNEENVFGLTSPWIGRSQNYAKTSPIPLKSNEMKTELNYVVSTPPSYKYPITNKRHNYQEHSIRNKPGVLLGPSPSNLEYYDSSHKFSGELRNNARSSTSESVQGETFSPRTIPLVYNEMKDWPNLASRFNSRTSSLARSLSEPKGALKSRLQSKPVSDTSLKKKIEHRSPQAITRNTFIPTHSKTATMTSGDSRESRETRQRPLVKKKYRRYMLPLLIAYKLKFFTLIPLLMGGLVMLVGSTGLAGFFFALFAAVMGLKSKGVH